MAVMNRRWTYFTAANKFVLNINLNLILITEMIELILLHPACIGVFLVFLVIILIFGDIDIPDGFILLSGVRLPRNRYHAGINHWSFRGRKTVLRPKLVQLLKKFFTQFCRGEFIV